LRFLAGRSAYQEAWPKSTIPATLLL
jgi:hypothetical protein